MGISNTRKETWFLTERAFFRGRQGGGRGECVTVSSNGRGSGTVVTEGETGQSLTFSTNADFKHPGAETVSSWHTEALVSGVVFWTHEYVTRGCEAVRLDAFHLHVFHIGEMDRPKERN